MEQYTPQKAVLKPVKISNLFNQYLAVKKTNRSLFDVFFMVGKEENCIQHCNYKLELFMPRNAKKSKYF